MADDTRGLSVMVVVSVAIATVWSACDPDTGPPGVFDCYRSRYYGYKYQWAKCVTNDYLVTSSKGRYECRDSQRTYCYYQCMLEVHDMDSGQITPDCACDPNVPMTTPHPPANASTIPPSCLSPNTTDCSWYSDCLRASYGCDPVPEDINGIAFGERFCRLYETAASGYTDRARAWVNNVRKCLLAASVPLLNPYETHTCETIRNDTRNSHRDCFVSPFVDGPSVCDLDHEEYLKVFWIIRQNFTSSFVESILALLEVRQDCKNLGVRALDQSIRSVMITLSIPIPARRKRRALLSASGHSRRVVQLERRDRDDKLLKKLAAVMHSSVAEHQQLVQDGSLLEVDSQRDASLLELDNQQDPSVVELDNQQDGSLLEVDNQQDAYLSKVDSQQDASLLELNNKQDAYLSEVDSQQDASLLELDNKQDAYLSEVDRQQDESLLELDSQQDASLLELDSQQDAYLSKVDSQLDEPILEADSQPFSRQPRLKRDAAQPQPEEGQELHYHRMAAEVASSMATRLQWDAQNVTWFSYGIYLGQGQLQVHILLADKALASNSETSLANLTAVVDEMTRAFSEGEITVSADGQQLNASTLSQCEDLSCQQVTFNVTAPPLANMASSGSGSIMTSSWSSSTSDGTIVTSPDTGSVSSGSILTPSIVCCFMVFILRLTLKRRW